MRTKIKKFSLMALAVIVASFTFSAVVFAQGDTICTGGISGTTDLDAANPNGGRTYFSELDEFGTWFPTPVPLDIVGVATGFAPALRSHAACADEADDTFDSVSVPWTVDFAGDEYIVRGWTWNNIVGFISMYCDGNSGDGKNEGVNCGAYDYFVKIGPDVAGIRELEGYAWNPAYGYISLKGSGGGVDTSGSTLVPETPPTMVPVILLSTTYQVETSNADFMTNRMDVTVDGTTFNMLQGETRAFTPNLNVTADVVDGAGGQNWVTLDVDYPVFNYGVKMDSASGDLSGYAYTDAGVWLNFTGANIQLPGAPLPPAVDWCDNKPWVCLEITPDPSSLSFDDADIGTEDGVPIANGDDDYTLNLYLREADGVTHLDPLVYDLEEFFKSIRLEWEDTVKIDQTVDEVHDPTLFKQEYPWLNKIGGVTYKPVSNLTIDDFTQDPTDPDHWTLDIPITSFTPTSNGNISMTTSSAVPFAVFNESFPVGLNLGTVEPNNLILQRLIFELEDRATGTPIVHDDLDKVIFPNGRNGLSFKFRPAIELRLLYAGFLEDAIEAIRASPVPFVAKFLEIGGLSSTVLDSAVVNMKLDYAKEGTEVFCKGEGSSHSFFDFYFTKDLDGITYDGMSEEQRPIEKTSRIGEFFDKIINFGGIAEVPLDEDDGTPCSYALDPTLYSEIQYNIEGQDVAYYSNKLPRFSGVLANPAAEIQGQVYAQVSYSPNEDVELDGVDIDIDTIRTTMDQNIQRVLPDTLPTVSGDTCIITALSPSLKVEGCSSPSNYVTFKVGDEQVLYFKGNDVVWEAKEWSDPDDWVIIVDGGNMFINNDIYNSDGGDQHLAILTFRRFKQSYADAGNLYLDCNVNNIQANVLIDGSLFSYCWDQFKSGTLKLDKDWGEPEWEDFQHRVDSLECQLLLEGSLSSMNTLGGGEITSSKPYFLKGTGEFSKDAADRLSAQNYDLNFLRMFRLAIENSPNGPIDQKCGKALTPEEVQTVYDGGTVCGEKPGCVPPPAGDPDQPTACDGIDLQQYDESTGVGDLMVPQSGCLAQGLNEGEYGPVYIRYVPPSGDSFVFFKKGTPKIGN